MSANNFNKTQGVKVTATGLEPTIECRFTLKRVRDMTRTYTQGVSLHLMI